MVEDIEDEELIEQEYKLNNHRSIEAVFKEIELKIRVTQFMNNCEIYTLKKYDRNPPKISYKITETPSRPNEIILIDVL